MKNIALQSYNRPTEAEKKDRVIAGIGTAGYAVCIFLLAFLLKDCGGGGGGNGGTGDGYMSLDVAGVGTMVDGYGFEESIPTPEVPVEAPVSDDTPAITDDTPNESAPVVDNSKTNNTKPKDQPKDKPKDKPQETKPKPDPKVSNALNDAIKNMGGSGNTNGNGQQGNPNGNPNGNGTTNGGGSAGTGGGTGGGNGTGNGTGEGAGSGSGKGGNYNWTLSGRDIKRQPSLSEVAPDEGVVVVDIWVNANGTVTQAKANPSKSNTSNSQLYALAEQAAKKAMFSAKPGSPEQKGSIKITFKLK